MISDAVARSFAVAIFDLVNGAVRDVLKDEELSSLLKVAVRREIETRLRAYLDSNGSG